MATAVVRFGADTSNLEAGVAQAGASMDAWSKQVSAASSAAKAGLIATGAAAVELKNGFGNGLGSSIQNLKDLALVAAGGYVAFEGLKSGFDAFQSGMSEQIAVVQSVKNAITGYLENLAYIDTYAPLVEMANTGQGASFGALGRAVVGTEAAVGRFLISIDNWQHAAQIYSSGLLQMVGASMAAAGNINALASAAQGAGFDNATRYLQSLVLQLTKIPGVSNAAATAIQSQLGAINNYAPNLNAALVTILPKIAANREEAEKLTTVFAKFFSDPASNWNALTGAIGRVTPALNAQYQAALRTGNVNQMQAAGYRAILEEVQRVGQEKTRQLGEELQAYAQLGPLGTLLSAGIRSQVDEGIRFNAELDKMLAKERARSDLIGNRPTTPAQNAAASGSIIGQVNPATDQIKKVEAEIDTLQQHLKALQGPDWSKLTSSADWETNISRTTESLTALQSKLLQLKAQQAGGTPTQLVDLSSTRQAVSLGADALRDARATAAAAEKEVAELQKKLPVGATSVELTQKEGAALKAVLAVRQQELELQKSKNALAATNSDASDSKSAYAQAKADLAALKASNTVAPNTAPMIDAINRVAAAKKAADAEDEQDQADTENTAFENTKNKSQAAIALIKQEGNEKQISRQQELAQLLAEQAQEEAATKTHLQKLLAIYDEGTAGYKAAAKQLAQIDTASALERVQTTQKVQQEIAAEYTKSFEAIGNTVTQGFMGMIQGTENWRQMAQKIVLQVIEIFISAGVKMVADNASKVAMQVAQTVLGQTQQTAAVAAGNAARTAANATGAAASVAVNAGTIMEQLTTDAKAVFGGVFAFLAPTMGPFAAGPALAASGAVIAGHAEGAWQIPADHLAVVHQGEMIIPARQTPWAQDLIANAAGRAGSGGGDVHHHYHAHLSTTVNNPASKEDVLTHIKDNAHAVGRTLARAMSSSGFRNRN